MSQFPNSYVKESSGLPQSPSDEVFIIPAVTARQLSNYSDPPSPRSGILKAGSNTKINVTPGGKDISETGDAQSPELSYARKHVRHSIVSVDSTFDLSGLSLQQPAIIRCQRKLSVYLHTHVVLIIVSSLAILDAVCVIGQLIADIIIMQEKLSYFEEIDDDLTRELLTRLPELNNTFHEKWNLHAILAVLVGRDIHSQDNQLWTDDADKLYIPQRSNSQLNFSSQAVLSHGLESTLLHRIRRSPAVKVPGHEVDHGALYELTHACHLGSMAILSLLLLETILKVFAMGRKLKHHKLEIFDAVVVTISWCLDVALWEGIWAHPGTQAATFLMYLLPWRVIRIVNSFVLVIQEKEHVLLKIVKQRLRQALRRSKEALEKATSYRHEAKAMAGMCRKLGATEQEILACSPTGKAGRRGSVQSVLERAASLTFISTLSSMGSLPSLFDVGGSSSEDEENEDRNEGNSLDRRPSQDLTLRSQDSDNSDLKPDENRRLEDIDIVEEPIMRKSKLPAQEEEYIEGEETPTDNKGTDETTSAVEKLTDKPLENGTRL